MGMRWDDMEWNGCTSRKCTPCRGWLTCAVGEEGTTTSQLLSFKNFRVSQFNHPSIGSSNSSHDVVDSSKHHPFSTPEVGRINLASVSNRVINQNNQHSPHQPQRHIFHDRCLSQISPRYPPTTLHSHRLHISTSNTISY